MVVTATAMLPTTFINQKQKSYDDNQLVGKGSRDRQKNGFAATVSLLIAADTQSHDLHNNYHACTSAVSLGRLD